MTADLDLSRLDELAALSIPQWARGVWRRAFGRYPGREDKTTEVIWIQTPTLYADIRVAATDDPSPDARDDGFAGWLDVEDQVCDWHRPIDLHPRAEGGDQGAMFLENDVMIEVGLLANYMEEYHRIDPASRCFAASRGDFSTTDGKVRFAADGPVEILVSAGPHVIHARHDGASGLRYGRFDGPDHAVRFDVSVGDDAVLAAGSGPWTVWNNEMDEEISKYLLDQIAR